MTSMSEAPYEMLSRLQAEAGIKDTELAAILGVKEIQVARYKDGRTQLTRMRTDRFLTLCRKLKVSPWRLAGQTEPGMDARRDAETEAQRPDARQQEIAERVDKLWMVYLASSAGAADREAWESSGRRERRVADRRRATQSDSEESA